MHPRGCQGLGVITMELTVTAEIAARALGAGACRTPAVGTPINCVPQSELIWVENAGILSPDDLSMLPAPLWSMAASGSGYGYGYGHGDGSGSGYGDGYGDG